MIVTQEQRLSTPSDSFQRDRQSINVEDQSPRRLERIKEQIAPEIIEHFSGCGSPIPESIEGRRVLDLGCGTGRDVYLCAALAGPRGFVMGLDTEDEALGIARRNVEATMERFGFTEPNVAFRKGAIEKLHDAGLGEEDFDVIISNQALSMVGNKLKALREIYRVLKSGGEFYFSDVYTDRRHDDIDKAPGADLYGNAVYVGDFVRLAKKAGFGDPRIISNQPITDNPPGVAGGRMWAVTFRLFKASELEDGEEDYGHAAIYMGTVEGCAHHFALDASNRFETGRSQRIGGNTARIIGQSRFSKHFEVLGSFKHHFGPFYR